MHSGQFTNANGTINDISITSGNFTVGDDYLIIVSGQYYVTSVSDQGLIAVLHGGTTFEDSVENSESSSTTDKQNYHWFTKWNAVSGQDITMKFGTLESLRTISVDQVSILAINLGDLTENTDWFYVENGTDQTLSPTYGTDGTTKITFTPNGSDDWLVMGNAQIDPSSITVPQKTRITVNGSTIDTGLEAIQEGEDSTRDIMQHSLVKIYENLASGSTSFDIDTESSSNTGTRMSEKVFALRLNAFKNYGLNFTEAEVNLSTHNVLNNSNTSIVKTTLDPNNAGDVWNFGFFVYDPNSSELMRTRMQFDYSDTLATQTSDNYEQLVGWDNTDELPWYMQQITATTDALHTLEVNGTKQTTSRPVEDRSALILNLELSGGTAWTQNLTDGGKFGDSLTSTKTFVRSVSDGGKFGDSLTSTKTFVRSVSDGGKFGDSVQAGLAKTQNVSDGGKLGDSQTRSQTFSYAQNLSDGGILSDDIDASVDNANTIQYLYDGAKVGDIVTSSKLFVRSFSDGGILSDNLTTSEVIAYTQNLSDGGIAGDLLTTSTILVITQNLSDGSLAGDNVSAFLICNGSCTVQFSDGAKVSDNISVNKFTLVEVFNAIKLYLNSPTATRLGGIFAGSCPPTQFVQGISTNGTLICGTP